MHCHQSISSPAFLCLREVSALFLIENTFHFCRYEFVYILFSVACNAQNSEAETNPLECLTDPSCCFDSDLFVYRSLFDTGFMNGAPVCYYGPTAARYRYVFSISCVVFTDFHWRGRPLFLLVAIVLIGHLGAISPGQRPWFPHPATNPQCRRYGEVRGHAPVIEACVAFQGEWYPNLGGSKFFNYWKQYALVITRPMTRMWTKLSTKF